MINQDQDKRKAEIVALARDKIVHSDMITIVEALDVAAAFYAALDARADVKADAAANNEAFRKDAHRGEANPRG
jgi:hypothetical protein